MSITTQSISNELKKLNDFEVLAYYMLLRHYTTSHKAKYPPPIDIVEAIKTFNVEGEKYCDSFPREALAIPFDFIPVMAANMAAIAFTLQQQNQEYEEFDE